MTIPDLNIKAILKKCTTTNQNDDNENVSRQIQILPFSPVLSNILKDVVAFVEVRAPRDDRSDGVAHHLLLLGATVSKYFNRKVTHVFFCNGRLSTYKKAIKWNVPMVSVLWIEECKLQKKIVPVNDFTAPIPEEFTSPLFMGKIKRFKTMEPKFAEFDVVKSVERKLKNQERRRIRKECLDFLKLSPESQKRNIENIRVMGEDIIKSCTPNLTNEFKKTNFYDKTPVTVKENRKRKLFTPEKDDMLNFTPEETDDLRKETGSIDTKINDSDSASDFSSNFLSSGIRENKEIRLNFPSKARNKRNKLDDASDYNSEYSLHLLTKKDIKCSKRNRSITLKTAAIVFSSMLAHERKTAAAAIEKLGGFRIGRDVDETTSRVICGSPRRTLNVLFALVHGCWVLSVDWIFRSLKAGVWLPEEEFVLKQKFPVLERVQPGNLAFSHNICRTIFNDVDLIFLGEEVNVPKESLTELIRLCGGKIIKNRKLASILIGDKSSSDKIPQVAENWVLDSITQGKLLPIENYRII